MILILQMTLFSTVDFAGYNQLKLVKWKQTENHVLQYTWRFNKGYGHTVYLLCVKIFHVCRSLRDILESGVIEFPSVEVSFPNVVFEARLPEHLGYWRFATMADVFAPLLSILMICDTPFPSTALIKISKQKAWRKRQAFISPVGYIGLLRDLFSTEVKN